MKYENNMQDLREKKQQGKASSLLKRPKICWKNLKMITNMPKVHRKVYGYD